MEGKRETVRMKEKKKKRRRNKDEGAPTSRRELSTMMSAAAHAIPASSPLLSLPQQGLHARPIPPRGSVVPLTTSVPLSFPYFVCSVLHCSSLFLFLLLILPHGHHPHPPIPTTSLFAPSSFLPSRSSFCPFFSPHSLSLPDIYAFHYNHGTVSHDIRAS